MIALAVIVTSCASSNQPAAQPAPTPTIQVEPVSLAPSAAPSPAPSPEPERVRPLPEGRRVDIRLVAALGAVANPALEQAALAARPRVEACVVRVLDKHPRASGRIQVRVVTGDAGAVESLAHAGEDLGQYDPEVVLCVVDAFRIPTYSGKTTAVYAVVLPPIEDTGDAL